jgi:GNAT superfamily N-acetyltransferase
MASMTPYPSLAAIGAAAGSAIGRHLETTFRDMVGGENVANEAAFLTLISGEPHPLGNMALLSAPADLASAQAAVEPLVASGMPSAVLFPGLQVPPPAIDAYLSERGFASHGALPAMGVDIARLKATALPDGYEFIRIGGGADGEEWVRQFAVGYELPLGVARYFSPVSLRASTSADAPMQFFAIRKGGKIVSTSVCRLKDGVAGIYCVSTIPDERRKGLGEYVTAEPLRLAARLGYGVGILQSSEAGYPVYRKLGFVDFGGVPIYLRIPG